MRRGISVGALVAGVVGFRFVEEIGGGLDMRDEGCSGR